MWNIPWEKGILQGMTHDHCKSGACNNASVVMTWKILFSETRSSTNLSFSIDIVPQ